MTNLDLRLLLVFVAVFETRSVGAAAIRLGMSQPGLSTALARLRRQVGDVLFTKSASGMEATARARALIAPVRALIHSIESDVLAPPRFDPATSTRDFGFALSDIGEGIYLPIAIRGFQQAAPGATIRSVVLPPRELEDAMARGAVDLAAGYYPDIRSGQFFQRRVGLHSFACIVRQDHPLIRKPSLTMKQFSELGHVVVEAPGRSQEVFERFLKQQRVPRRVVLVTPHFMSVPVIVAETDAIAIVPQALADFMGAQRGVKQVRLPFVPPTFQVNLYWHRSAQNDPANRWLRELVIGQLHLLQARGYDRNGRVAPTKRASTGAKPAGRVPA